jgi:hypothetical protein
LYHYDANHIFLLPIKNKSQECLHAAYTNVHKQIKAAGLKLDFQIMDNECSQLLKTYMTTNHIDFQLVPPANHIANAAEHAIQTAKNHFIAGLCSCPSNFPLNQWDKLVPQAELTLNLMRGSRMNPKQSAWEQIHGHFDYNRTPLAPPGMNVMVYEPVNQRGSWGSHATEGHYIGPALESYRCYKIYTPSTRATRISDTVVWFPEQIPMPGANSTKIIAQSLQDIAAALTNPSPNAPLCPLQPNQINTLTQLIQIFDVNPAPANEPAVPRVAEEEEEDDETVFTGTLPPPGAPHGAAFPRVAEQAHWYPTWSAIRLPPARDSAYVARPNVPKPKTVTFTGSEDMYAALTYSSLLNRMEDTRT